MPKKYLNQKGSLASSPIRRSGPRYRLGEAGVVMQLLVVVVLLLGLVAGYFLLKNPQIFKSKATNPPIVVKNNDGTVNTPDASGIVQITNPTVKLEFTSPLGPAKASTSSATQSASPAK